MYTGPTNSLILSLPSTSGCKHWDPLLAATGPTQLLH